MTVGRRFMVGAPDGPPGDDALRLLETTGAAVLLLFRRNIREPGRTAEALATLRERLGRPLAVSIDHEGGQVLRHVRHSTVFPGNRALALAVEEQGLEFACELAGRQGAVMGAELASLGIGWNLAPALDLVCDRYNPGMTLRSYGSDPEAAGVLGAAFVEGVRSSGGATCAKHFPGTGEARVDPHEKLPRIEVDPQRLWDVHGAPFVALINAGVDSVMTSHGFFPRVDAIGPATFSREIVHGWLRGRMEFSGVITTDDLEMGAITTEGKIAAAAVSAARSGHDMLLLGQAADRWAREAIDAVGRAIDDGSVDGEEHRKSLARIDALVDRVDVKRLLAAGQSVPEGGLAPELATAIARAGARVVRDPHGLLPIAAGRPVRVVVPDVTPVADWICFESPWEDPGAIASRVFPNAEVWVSSLHEAAPLPPVANENTVDLVLLFDATENAGQAAVLDAIDSARTIVVPIRNFWDERLVPADATLLDPGGFRLCQLDAVADLIEES